LKIHHVQWPKYFSSHPRAMPHPVQDQCDEWCVCVCQ
jgi:hypothetical protein